MPSFVDKESAIKLPLAWLLGTLLLLNAPAAMSAEKKKKESAPPPPSLTPAKEPPKKKKKPKKKPKTKPKKTIEYKPLIDPAKRKSSWEGGKKKIKVFNRGIGLRGGALFVPEFFLNTFFFDESRGVSNASFGGEFIIRTTDTFEYVIGINYHMLSYSGDGVFLEKGDEQWEREAITNSLSTLMLDVHFVKHVPITPGFKWFVGGGVGVGLVLGKLVRTDMIEGKVNEAGEPDPGDYCSTATDDLNNHHNDCQLNKELSEDKDIKDKDNPQGRREDRVPPVLPQVELVTGFLFQFNPRWDLRIQGGAGLPRLFFVGLSTHFFF